jgi:hypothetical protein
MEANMNLGKTSIVPDCVRFIGARRLALAVCGLAVLGLVSAGPAGAAPVANSRKKCVCACDVPGLGAEKLLYFNDSNCKSAQGKGCEYTDDNVIPPVPRKGKMAQCGKNLDYKPSGNMSAPVDPTGGPATPPTRLGEEAGKPANTFEKPKGTIDLKDAVKPGGTLAPNP